MKYYQFLIFLCIIFCINSNFTTTKIIPLEKKASSIEPYTKDTKKISNDTFESKKQGAIKIIQNLDLEQLEILVKIIDDYHKSESTTLKISTITTTTYSLATATIPSSTCVVVFSVLIIMLIGIIIYMIIINDLKIVPCGKIIRERTESKQIKV